MTLADNNLILRTYLLTQPVAELVEDRIYCPRAPEGASVPNITFFTRGGTSMPYIPDIPSPSVQFDCWADNPITAREIYRALYDALQGIQNIPVEVDGTDYVILSAREEVQGQDLVDVDIPGRFRVLTFFEIQMR